ncbi:MAG: hypothetical protein WCO56_23015 [Verrucomicrobiota bacterium]
MDVTAWKEYLPKDLSPWMIAGLVLAALVVGYCAMKVGKLILQMILGLVFFALAGGLVWYFCFRQ